VVEFANNFRSICCQIAGKLGVQWSGQPGAKYMSDKKVVELHHEPGDKDIRFVMDGELMATAEVVCGVWQINGPEGGQFEAVGKGEEVILYICGWLAGENVQKPMLGKCAHIEDSVPTWWSQKIIGNEKLTFPMGELRITRAALELVKGDVFEYITMHTSGNWGIACQADWRENDLSVKRGFRIISWYYVNEAKDRIMIITEADRSYTTILLPEEY